MDKQAGRLEEAAGQEAPRDVEGQEAPGDVEGQGAAGQEGPGDSGGAKKPPVSGAEALRVCSTEALRAFASVYALIDRLTGEDGCPWDREQTPESLTEYLMEECCELIEAIRFGSPEDLAEELGDVAFLVCFIGRLSERRGGPSLAQAMNGNTAKMIRRHPHVFGDAAYGSRDEQLRDWERIKREEKAEGKKAEGKKTGLYASLPRGVPPLTRAYRIHSKAAQVGFTWTDDEDVERQVEAEWLEYLDAAARGDREAAGRELGDHFFTLVELARRQGVKAAVALDGAAGRFLSRFERMEALAEARGQDFRSLSLDEKDELWNEVKAGEKAAGEKAPDPAEQDGE